MPPISSQPYRWNSSRQNCNRIAIRLGIRKLLIFTDCDFVVDVVNGITSRPIKWTAYYCDFEDLDLTIRRNPQIDIIFNSVKAHSGNVHHNEAGHLAWRGANFPWWKPNYRMKFKCCSDDKIISTKIIE